MYKESFKISFKKNQDHKTKNQFLAKPAQFSKDLPSNLPICLQTNQLMSGDGLSNDRRAVSFVVATYSLSEDSFSLIEGA